MDELARLMIEQTCRTLVLRAARSVDANEPARLAEVFTDDGVLVRPNGDALHGREAIRAAYEQRGAGRITRHLVTDTLVDVLGDDEAVGVSRVLLWIAQESDENGAHGRPVQRQVLGRFDDRFVLTGHGWRIARREARFELHCGG